jgi:trk system potassium uptake protein TrkH
MMAAFARHSARMRRLLALAHLLGALILGLGLAGLIPLVWSLWHNDGAAPALWLMLGLCVLVGLPLWWPQTRARSRLDLPAREGCLLVVLAVLCLSAVSGLPFWWHEPSIGWEAAFFEGLAALTTTGLSRIGAPEHWPQSLLLWRHLLQWLGGMGIIVLAVAILPLLGVGGMQLFRADTPGPMKDTRLAPRIMQTARYLWLVYLLLTLACGLALLSVGMPAFDALCHALSTVSLGGFSTRSGGIDDWDSPYIEGVLIIFMLLAAFNFTTHFIAARQRSLVAYLRDPEAGAVLAVVLVSLLLMLGLVLLERPQGDGLEHLRHLAFASVSMATTAGFASIHAPDWPPLPALWLMLLGALVASSGSTGGGIRMIRTLILVKQALRELLRMSHPRAVRPLVLGGQIIAPEVVQAVLGFMLLYGVTLLGLTALLVATGLDGSAAFGLVMAGLNNGGEAFSALGLAPDVNALSSLQAWILAFAMLAGRLELLIVFVLLTPGFWRR